MRSTVCALTSATVLVLLSSCGPATNPMPKQYFWASSDGRITRVDVIDLTPEELSLVDALSAKYQGTDEALPYDAPAVPVTETERPTRFEVGRSFHVLTASGSANLEVRGFSASYGASQTHWLVFTNNLGTQQPEGLALYNDEFPKSASLAKLPGDTELTDADVALAKATLANLCALKIEPAAAVDACVRCVAR